MRRKQNRLRGPNRAATTTNEKKMPALGIGQRIILTVNNYSGLIALAALVVSLLAIKSQENIAEKSGAYDRGQLTLSFAGFPIEPIDTVDVYYGMSFQDSILNFSILPFTIHNIGRKTVEDVLVLFKYPHVAKLALTDSLTRMTTSYIDPIERKAWTADPYDQVAFKFKSINPNYSLSVDDIISTQNETKAQHIFPIVSKDGDTVMVTASYEYSYSMQVGTSAKDVSANLYLVNLSIVRADSLSTILNEVIKKITSTDLSTKRSFFLVVPKIARTTAGKNFSLRYLEPISEEILYCQFDKTGESLLVTNQDGTTRKLIELKSL